MGYEWKYVSKGRVYLMMFDGILLFIIGFLVSEIMTSLQPERFGDPFASMKISLFLFTGFGALILISLYNYALKYEINAMKLTSSDDIVKGLVGVEQRKLLDRCYEDLIQEIEKEFDENNVNYEKRGVRSKDEIWIRPYVHLFEIDIPSIFLYVIRDNELKICVGNVKPDNQFYFDSFLKGMIEDALSKVENEFRLKTIERADFL